MTLTIDLDPGIEHRLQALATERGVPIAEYVKAVLERQAIEAVTFGSQPQNRSLTPDEWADAFLQWAGSHRTDTPLVPLEALRRENLYEDRGT